MKKLIAILSMIVGAQVNGAFAQELNFNANPNQDRRRVYKPDQRQEFENLRQPDTLSGNALAYLKETYKLPDQSTINIARTSDGRIYTGKREGIKMQDASSSILISKDNADIPENNVSALALDRNHHLWIGTYSSGVVIGIGKDIKPFKIKLVKTRELKVFSISVDENGLVWVTYRNGGIECFKDDISYAYYPAQ